jgi:AmiR/NasT family two-component response regulator
MTKGLAVSQVAASPTPLEVALKEIDTLNEALATRSMIGQAIGILMIEMTITAEAAFAHLVTLSSHTNTKLREVAGSIVEEANRRASVER